MTNWFKKSKARRKIAVWVKDIMSHLDEVTQCYLRYKIDDRTSMVDPRLVAIYSKVSNLVGLDKPSCELMSMLQTPQRDGKFSGIKMKIVSVFGTGGLGKTTLAKYVYDKLKGDYDCGAFVPVGRNPDSKKVFKDILIDLDRQRNLQFSTADFDERQLINELHSFFLENKKRYFIVIDDIWEVRSWETIRLAIDYDNNQGGRIIITAHKLEVATKAGKVYKLQPLPSNRSRELFYTRISCDEGRHVDYLSDKISDEILKKCCGIPLAIITMASLLAGKPREIWSELYKSIGFGCNENSEEGNIVMKILSFSYNDLPSYLRTCFLNLSAFPEESVIHNDCLVWKWVAEGFVHEQKGIRLFEIGEGYFNDLINRSLIQAVESNSGDGTIIGCRVHDMVLDFIHSMSRETNFFTVLESDQLMKPLRSNARRLAQHNRTIRRAHEPNHFDDMQKVRSFSAHGCVIETWIPFSSFTLLRVLAIENCIQTNDYGISTLGHLLHLRYLSLKKTPIHKIHEDIGGLRFLQTLDLSGCNIVEIPCSSLPTQLVCLRITFDDCADDRKVGSLKRLTSLEDLSVAVTWNCRNRRWLVKEVGSLRELRVLNATVFTNDKETEKDLVESLRHLHKLQHLEIEGYSYYKRPIWELEGFDLPRHLRHFAVHGVILYKLPACINRSCLPILSHLHLCLGDMHDQDLKILGGLPELVFLELELMWHRSAATIRNISDSEAVYFPKLRCCRLPRSMVFFVPNKEDKSLSFHLWDFGDIAMSSAASEDENEDSICREAPAALPFMPNLQALHFRAPRQAEGEQRYCDNLGLEYLSSLQEISVSLSFNLNAPAEKVEKVEAALRRAADRHPNRPTLVMGK